MTCSVVFPVRLVYILVSTINDLFYDVLFRGCTLRYHAESMEKKLIAVTAEENHCD